MTDERRRLLAVAGGVLAAVAVVVGAVMSGCGADDRDLREPSASQTTTTAPVPGASDAVGTATELSLQLTTDAFQPGGVIPDEYTCRGANVSPPLQWINLPAGVTELALVMVDPDADGFVHWVVTEIPPTVGSLTSGALPQGAVAGPNDAGGSGWFGPCPPAGNHTYRFQLLALSQPPELTPGLDAKATAAEVSSWPALATATLTGTVAAAG